MWRQNDQVLIGDRLGVDERFGFLKYIIQHLFGKTAGERVLLTGMVRTN